VEIMRESLPAGVGVIAAGAVRDLASAIALLDAGAQRVSTNAAPVMVDTLMGVAA
jgi:deoxyribose-phosphate aldolase